MDMDKVLKSVLGTAIVIALSASVLGVFSSSASAWVDRFCTYGAISPYSRCVAPVRVLLYGVGAEKLVGIGDTYDNPCLGAKQNSDGSGGNALPFTCITMTYGQIRWTPGGSSGTGYATIINNDAWTYWMGGYMNRA
jgi:hypothetical protein